MPLTPPMMRPPSHEPLDFMQLMETSHELRQGAEDGVVSDGMITEIASRRDVPEAHVVAAMILVPDLRLDHAESVRFMVCAGRCQLYGAVPNLERLLALRRERAEKGQASFGVSVRHCLDQCQLGPVMVSRSPHGIAAHHDVVADQVDEIVDVLCGALGSSTRT